MVRVPCSYQNPAGFHFTTAIACRHVTFINGLKIWAKCAWHEGPVPVFLFAVLFAAALSIKVTGYRLKKVQVVWG